MLWVSFSSCKGQQLTYIYIYQSDHLAHFFSGAKSRNQDQICDQTLATVDGKKVALISKSHFFYDIRFHILYPYSRRPCMAYWYTYRYISHMN